MNIELPHVGESVTEAIIGAWLKSVGDTVEKYDPIVEVITDKVAMEVPAPASGTITRIIAEEGATVDMGAVIAEMETADEPAGTAEQADGPELGRIGTMVTAANVGPTGGEFVDTSLSASGAPSAAAARMPAPVEASSGKRVSPVVARLVAEHGIDLSAVTGTGLGGRVTRKDVLAVVETAGRRQPAPAETPVLAPGDSLVEPSPIRKITAAHVTRSYSEIPHAWSAVEVDVGGLTECRAARRDQFRSAHGVDLTYLPFALQVVATALRSNPLINSSWAGGKIHLKADINVGIAVAAGGGLVVPVVHDADASTVSELALKLAEVVGRARGGNLTREDVQGGTFTLNNTGALGSVWGGAIINHPQAAILTTESIVKRPVVVSGDAGDEIIVRPMMNICLSFDHRIIDGAVASKFLQDVRTGL